MFTDLAPYPEYHDPGLEWLARVPRSWSTTKLKRVVRMSGGMTPAKERRDFWDGDIPWVTPKDMKREFIADSIDRVSLSALEQTGLSYVEPGAVLIVVRGMILARTIPIAMTAAPVTINQDMKALIPSLEVHGGYLAALLRGSQQALAKCISESGHGTRKIETSSLLDFRVPVPSLGDQQSIVKYLTHAHRRIDQAIDAKRRLIGLLEEQKQTVISQAVTRGLDPAVKLKDSGIDWLGGVPVHWGISALRHRYQQDLGKMLDSGRMSEDELLPYLRNVDVQWDRINRAGLPTMVIPPAEYGRYTVQAGDLLVCEGGEVGRSAIWDGDDRTGFQKALHRLRPHNPSNEVPRYLMYALRVAARAGAFDDGRVSTIAHLTGESLRRHRFAWPNVDEQRAIVEFVDSSSVNADAAINRATREIDLLEEFRTRLTADVVTGQVDVRDIAARLPNIDPAEVTGDVTGGNHDGLNDEATEYLEDITV